MGSPAAASLPASSPVPSFRARVLERLRLWFERRRWIGELRGACALSRFEALLEDAALSRADVGALIEAPADAGRQFEALAAALGVDVSRFHPQVLREAVRVCVRCQHRGPCKRRLRAGGAIEGEGWRCPNAALFER